MPSNGKAKRLFAEYLDQVNNNVLGSNPVVYSAYLDVFCKCGDIKSMIDVRDQIIDKGFEIDHVMVANMMMGYFSGNDPENCINILTNWLKLGNPATMIMMHLKCVALVALIRRRAISFDTKYFDFYLELIDTIYRQLKVHGLSINHKIAKTHLGAAVALYCHYNPWRIDEICMDLCKDCE